MTGTRFKKLKTFGIQTWNEMNASNKQNNNINKQQKNNIPINTHFDRYKKTTKKRTHRHHCQEINECEKNSFQKRCNKIGTRNLQQLAQRRNRSH